MSGEPSPIGSKVTPYRSRAKRACKSCNARRIRCDVTEQQPCGNCKNYNTSCELISSRRGKYDRKSRSSRPGNSGIVETPSDFRSADDGTLSPCERSERHECGQIPRVLSQNNIQGQGHPFSTLSPNVHETPSRTASVNGSERERNTEDGCVYLGESNSISLVHSTGSQAQDSDSPFSQTRLQYPVPDAVKVNLPSTPSEDRRREAKIRYLTEEGALSFPPPRVCEALLKAYFTWFHPCFPILSRPQFYKSYCTNTISPLLYQAVLFIGASHCNEQTLREIGLNDRHEVRSSLYNYAKDIYDADYESDKVIVCQALFLMSFWRAGPLLEKDTRHWLGAAIGLAQTKGMHRSLSTIQLGDTKLRKRLWWSLYIRDRQSSAALGLPLRIRCEEGDIEMIDEADFHEDDSIDIEYPDYFGQQRTEHSLYFIQMVRLATFLGTIILHEFSHHSECKVISGSLVVNRSQKRPSLPLDREMIRKELLRWEEELPREMKSTTSLDNPPGFWASMLHLAYNNVCILLYRSAYLNNQDRDVQAGQVALQAACRNTRIIEDVLSQDLVQYANVHIVTSLFNSLCIHTIHLRRSEGTTRKLAEYRAQLSLLGLREVQKTWDVTNWVLQLFLQFLDQSVAKRLQQNDNDEASDSQPFRNTSMPPDQTPSFQTDASPLTVDGSITARSDDFSKQGNLGLDFASQLFATREAEDFSMFQLQPGFYNEDFFGGGLDYYYNSVMGREYGNGNH